MTQPHDVDAIVIGAGPAGLATSRELAVRGVQHVVLERGPDVAHSWANLYDSLTLHTGRHMSSLPGLGFPRGTPLFVTRGRFVDYLRSYARHFDLPVRPGHNVVRVERADGGWRVHTSQGVIGSASVVVATGIIAAPRVPALSGRERFGGRLLHSIEYRRPAPFVGRRVLVVGVGNSGGEIGSELARAGARVTVAVRSGANVVPLTLLGLPIQYASYLLRKLPRPAQEVVVGWVGRLTELRRGPPVLPRPAHGPLDAIPLIGFNLVDEIRAGRVQVRANLAELTEGGARFADGREEPFDDVILATGFSAALGFLRGLVRVDARGFALRRDRVVSVDQPGLYVVGHNYDATGGLWNIRMDAPRVAEIMARARA
jgi:cation diffusion facilitator CzcD-associated flavoprotein CzcO